MEGGRLVLEGEKAAATAGVTTLPGCSSGSGFNEPICSVEGEGIAEKTGEAGAAIAEKAGEGGVGMVLNGGKAGEAIGAKGRLPGVAASPMAETSGEGMFVGASWL